MFPSFLFLANSRKLGKIGKLGKFRFYRFSDVTDFLIFVSDRPLIYSIWKSEKSVKSEFRH